MTDGVLREMTYLPRGSIWPEVQAERERAHAKHGRSSMEELDPLDLVRLTVLLEEVGEVARWFNERRHAFFSPAPNPDHVDLRAELIQVAAMAGAWAEALTYQPPKPCSGRRKTDENGNVLLCADCGQRVRLHCADCGCAPCICPELGVRSKRFKCSRGHPVEPCVQCGEPSQCGELTCVQHTD